MHQCIDLVRCTHTACTSTVHHAVLQLTSRGTVRVRTGTEELTSQWRTGLVTMAVKKRHALLT